MTRSQRRQEQRRRPRRQISGNLVFFGVALGILVVGIAGGMAVTGGFSPTPSPTPPAPTVDGIPCQTNEVVTSHVHSHVEILVNGQARVIPAGTGIPGSQVASNGAASGGICFYWLHVHAADGIIHEEAPAPTNFTLGQIFDIWHKTLSRNQVGEAKGPVLFFLDGKPWDGDPRKIPLHSHAVIVAEIGKPVLPPPAFTDWAHTTAGG